MIVAVPKDSLTIAGQTLKTFDDVGESGLPVLRRFCGKCGSPIVSHVEAMPDLAFIKAGTLENTSWLNPTMEVWCETAQPWIDIDEAARRAQSAARGLMAATTLWQNPLSRRPRSRTTRWTTSFVDNFHIDPPLVVKDTPKPRRLASLGEARAYVDEALRLGRPEAWREVYDRLRAVAGEEDALEAIGDLRELLELEDLLILPVLPLEQRHRSPR